MVPAVKRSLPENGARRFVERAELRAARSRRNRPRHFRTEAAPRSHHHRITLADKQQGLRDEQAAAARIAERRKVQRFQQADGPAGRRRSASSMHMLAFVEVDSRDAAVRRLEEWQALGPRRIGAQTWNVIEIRSFRIAFDEVRDERTR